MFPETFFPVNKSSILHARPDIISSAITEPTLLQGNYDPLLNFFLLGSGMSVLSMVAFRMVTQEGLRKCLKIYEELNKSSEKTVTPLTASTTSTTDTHNVKSSANSSRSAKRRVRRKKFKESRRGEENAAAKMQKEEDAKESRDDESVDITPYNLVTHADRRTSKDFLERSLMAAFLLKCLQRIGFFAQPTPDNGTHHLY